MPPVIMWWEGKKVGRKMEDKKVRKWFDLISFRQLHNSHASSNDMVGGQESGRKDEGQESEKMIWPVQFQEAPSPSCLQQWCGGRARLRWSSTISNSILSCLWKFQVYRMSQNEMTNQKNLNHNSVLCGQICPSKWLESAWSWLFLARIEQNQTK